MSDSKANLTPEHMENLILKQRLLSIEELSSPVFHDLNNVFGTVLGLSELLELKLGEKNPYQKLFKTTIRAVHRATGFTRQLSLFLKENPHDEGPTSLRDELEGMVTLLQSFFRDKSKIGHNISAQIPLIRIHSKTLRDIIASISIYMYQIIPDTDGTFQVTLESQEDETQLISFSINSNCPFSEDYNHFLAPHELPEPDDSEKSPPSLYATRLLIEKEEGTIEVIPDGKGTGTCIRVSLPVL